MTNSDQSATPELLRHLVTIERTPDKAGAKPERWRDPAHRRLRRTGAIQSEHEAAIQTLIEAWLLHQHGARDAGMGGGDGAGIVNKQMLAGDTVRGFVQRFGAGALVVVTESCEECLHPAIVAHRRLGFRDPRNPARPSRRWHVEGQAILDRWLVGLVFAMVPKNTP